MLATLVDRDVVEVVGGDAASYLQGQISQDVASISQGGSAWSLILAPTGKLQAWFRLHHLAANRFLIDIETLWAKPLIARLQQFVLRSDVAFNALDGWRMLSLRHSTEPIEVVAQLSADFAWPSFSGRDYLSPALQVPTGVTLTEAASEEARILAAVPRLGQDITENMIPAEAGPHFISESVSFTKGCYTGQELVARIDSRGGNVPRLLRVLIAQSPLREGTAVIYEEAQVGEVRSAAGSVALAPLLRKVPLGAQVLVDGVMAQVKVPQN